jgi:hypothetical protein
MLTLLFWSCTGNPKDSGSFTNQEPELTLADIEIGDLIITEIMINPSDCTDDSAEYLELKNNTDRWVNIKGLTFQDGNSSYQLEEDVLASPKSLILGRLNSVEDCFSLGEDFNYDLQWDNTGDSVEIKYEATSFDRVDFVNWVIPEGASLTLSSSNMNSTTNDDETSWCPAPNPIANEYNDLGSPGVENPTCTQ